MISCAPLVSTKTEQLLVVDIGGGSTELVWIDLTNVPKRERPHAIMRLHAGFKCDPALCSREGSGLDFGAPWVATLRDQFADVEDDAARFALMSWFFEENLEEFSPYAAAQTVKGFRSWAPAAR